MDYNDQWIIIEQDQWSCGIEQGTQNTTDLSYIQLNLHHRKYYTQVCMQSTEYDKELYKAATL